MKKRIISAAIILIMLSLSVLSLTVWRGSAADAQRTSAAQTTNDGRMLPTDDYRRADMAQMRLGYVTFDGKQYYYDENGEMCKGGIVGSDAFGYTVADADGVCCVSEEIRLAAAYLVKYCTGDTPREKLLSAFRYMVAHFPYVRSYDHPSSADQMAALAVDMLANECGNCYRYAASFAAVAKAIGYRVRVVIGTTAGNPHGWVEVLAGKKWYICDPCAQLEENNLPEDYTFMMSKHCWQITPKARFELTVKDGAAVWTSVKEKKK